MLGDNIFVNLIKSNTICFKSKPGTCIDIVLTNKPKTFQNTGVTETSVSDHRDRPSHFKNYFYQNASK